ncbi:hypothetical protein ACP70R_003616 [Stipagrostis hirtigluma subsp. patula]
MGLLALQRLMSMQRDRQRRRRRTPDRNGPIASHYKRKGSPCRQDGDGHSHTGKIMRYSIPDLPEDIWCHIHSLMPLHDAARAACLSRAFLRSWRHYPNLTLNRDTLRSEEYACKGDFSDKIARILRNHTGKILKLELKDVSCRFLDSWLHVAVTSGIEELTVVPRRHKIKYNFRCSLLSKGVRNSVRYIYLAFCAFRPTPELGPMRSLTSLHLCVVHITDNELECFLANATALEQLALTYCDQLTCLKIPCVLQQLVCLRIYGCQWLQVIENKAPNLSSLSFTGKRKLSLGETVQIKDLAIFDSKIISYARTELPSVMPYLEILDLTSDGEAVNTPMLSTKFLCLKHLSISTRSGLAFSPKYDYCSLVSFLDASPSLETLVLDVSLECLKHESVFGNSQLRQIPEHRHCCLKSMKIIGFSSAKSLVELACYVLKNAVSLECVTLDTLYGFRCSGENDRKCQMMCKSMLREAPRAAAAIRAYIEDKVPSTVRLTVLEPCSRCHYRPWWSV